MNFTDEQCDFFEVLFQNDYLPRAVSSSKLTVSFDPFDDIDFCNCFNNNDEYEMTLLDDVTDVEFSDVELSEVDYSVSSSDASVISEIESVDSSKVGNKRQRGGEKTSMKASMKASTKTNMMKGPIWNLVKSMHDDDKATLGHIEKLFLKTRCRKRLEAHEAACISKVIYDVLNNPKINEHILPNCGALLRQYPGLCECSPVELCYLVKFCNAMRIGKELIPGNLHKQLLINICTFAEGSGNVYVTGSGAKKATRIRVQIYETECCIEKSRRTTKKTRT